LSHSRKKKKPEQSLEIPITPMLDMAFQLLTFFILTYHPMPTEGQYVMNLAPAAPVSDPNAKASETPPADGLSVELKTLPTVLRAGGGGELARIMLGENELGPDPKELKAQLDSIFKDPTLPYEQTLIKVDPSLKYSALVKIIQVFSNAFADAKKEAKLSFAELTPSEMQ
jgi:biopolymer transport protein ExbD